MEADGGQAVQLGGGDVHDQMHGIVPIDATPFALVQVARYRRDELPVPKSYSEISIVPDRYDDR